MNIKLNISQKKTNLLRAFIGLTIGALFFWLAIRTTSIDEVKNILLTTNLNYLFMGLFFYFLDMYVRVIRWRQLLIHLKKISVKSLSIALLVGYAMNNLLPARLGELFRADFAGKYYQLSRVAVVASIVVERTFDGLIVVFCLILGRIFIPNNSIIDTIIFLGGLLFTGIFLLLWILNKGYGKKWLFQLKIPPFIIMKIKSFKEGLNIIGRESLIKVIAISAIVWILETLAVWCVLKSVNMTLSWQEMLSFIGVISLSTLLPSAPGFVGTYQYAYAFMANLFGYETAQGIAAATVTQVFLLGSLTVLGLLVYTYVVFMNKGVKYDH